MSRNTFELSLATGLESEVRSEFGVPHPTCNQHLTWLRFCCNACTDMHGDPTDVTLSSSFYLAQVQAASDFQLDLPNCVADRTRTSYRQLWLIENCDKAVASRGYLPAVVLVERPTHDLVVPSQDLSPTGIA